MIVIIRWLLCWEVVRISQKTSRNILKHLSQSDSSLPHHVRAINHVLSFPFAAEPKYLNISIPDDKMLASVTAGGGGGSAEPVTIGAYNEGTEMRLACESGGGKPIPRVTWYNDRGEVIAGMFYRAGQKNGPWVA